MKNHRILSVLLLSIVAVCAGLSAALSSDTFAWVFTESDGRLLPEPLRHFWQFVLPLGLGASIIIVVAALTALRSLRSAGSREAVSACATGLLAIGALAGTLSIVDAPPTIQVLLHRPDALARKQPEYSLPRNPSEPFLTLSYSGGFGSLNPSWSLHPDGTLVFRRLEKVESRFTLTKEETEEFAIIAAAGGLMDLGPDDLRERFRRYYCSDCGSLRLQVTLDRLDRSTGLQRMVRADVRLDGGAWELAARYPESKELQAVHAISELMRQYRTRGP